LIKMEVYEILDRKDKLVQFLKEKGFNEEKDYPDEDYKDGTYFKIDKGKLLVVYEIVDEEKLKEVKDHFLIDRGLSYCIIIFNHKLIFYRNFGETKHFIYSERTKNNVSKKDKLENIKDFDSIFQSKDISGLFYEAFKHKRDLLVQHIKNEVEPIQKYLTAQKIFDRFFFIYFLCHKGIIKFEDGRKISGENLFSRILLKEKDFLDNLKKLFHLFNSQEKDVFEIGDYKIVIPYLNGGLFRPDVLEQTLDISLKNNQWGGIFEFLNSYHWIIEDVKTEEENEDKILTPEILGHVYERSVVEWEQKGFEEEAEDAVKKVTERKKKGVYYTPESITDYISNNTIIPYLLDKLDNKYNSFDDLIESGNKHDYKKALSILDEIKVLDPACGSGAFLIKASEVIFGLKRRLYYKLKEKQNFYDLKLDVITENIYGVDILTGAVEISKLRLWLWLISDYEESRNKIKALPNIEYNLRVGNSLVGWLDEKLTQLPINTPLTEKVDGIFTGLIAFSENGDSKDLKNARELLESYKLENYIEAYYLLYRIYRRTHGLKAENLRSILETIRKSIYSTVTPAFLEFINKKIKPKYDIKKPPITQEEFNKLNIFHWRIDFGHIILNNGFDVVIGNPPYGNILKEIEKKIIRYFKTFRAQEIAANFVERSLYFMAEDAYLGQIVANSIAINKSTSECRSIIRKHMSSSKIALFGTRPAKIFCDAEIRVMIVVGKKDNPPESGIIYTTDAMKLTQQTKNTFLNKLCFESTKGLELGERKIGDATDVSLPKVGYKLIRSILLKLKSKSKITFKDIISREGRFSFEFRKTGGYWLNALEKMPYKSTKIEKIYFENEVQRNFGVILINSSLFYLYWSTYGNLRDFPLSLFRKFPIPDITELNKKSKIIEKLKVEIESTLLKSFKADTGRVGEFRTAKCKTTIDKIDKLLSFFYDIDEHELHYLISYDDHIRPNLTPKEEIKIMEGDIR